MRLFRYIDQGNSKTEKIAMTTPVFTQKHEGNETMAFVLPASMSSNDVPEPLDENVQVRTRPTGLYAVYRYSGKKGFDRVTQTGPKLSLVWTGSLFAQCRRVSQCWDAGRA